jgi:Peptidase family M23
MRQSASEESLNHRGTFPIVLGLSLFAMVTVRFLFDTVAIAQPVTSPALTPLILAIHDAPIPFAGSDGKTHLVYEVFATNFSSLTATIEQVEVLGDGKVLQTLNTDEVASRLQPAGLRTSRNTMPTGTQSVLFVHLILPKDGPIPAALSHRFTVNVHDQTIVESGGPVTVDRRPVAIFGPPLSGSNFISADSCCDATRHTRAALPIDGRVWVSQRYAVDWERADDQHRIYAGPRTDVKSYKIYGAQVLAVADATVTSAVDGLPNQLPGEFPEKLPLTEADGNHVILDLGNGNYALYAHMIPGSLRVHTGQKVKQGQVIGLVGNSGNTIAPHLHFQLMNHASSFDANGLPYEISAFQVIAHTLGTAAFDEAEAKGTPLDFKTVAPPSRVKNAMPLDQLIISFSP